MGKETHFFGDLSFQREIGSSDHEVVQVVVSTVRSILHELVPALGAEADLEFPVTPGLGELGQCGLLTPGR